MQSFRKFMDDEDGAVTVDFVVITAAICLLGFIVVFTFSGEAIALGNDISVFMEDQCANGPCN